MEQSSGDLIGFIRLALVLGTLRDSFRPLLRRRRRQVVRCSSMVRTMRAGAASIFLGIVQHFEFMCPLSGSQWNRR